MSKEPQVRDVVPFKQGKRPSTARKLNLTFAGGTALEEALASQEKATPHHSPPLPTTPQETSVDIAPRKDFNRRANSLERDAMPAGLFRGASKKLYDALYLRSRGAITPRRRVRASRRDLLEWTGIRNLKTIDSHIHYLMAAGLITRHWELGSNEGSEYEVLLPEEIEYPRLPTTHHHSPGDTTSQKTGSGYTQILGSGGDSQTIVNTDTSETPKTFIRQDQNIDDETFADMVLTFRKVAEEITGKPPTKTDSARWNELAELLGTELKIAAARTTVSNVPAFLTEHLRRRLWKVDKVRANEIATEQISKAPALKDEEKRKCPDCAGTNFWYPEGSDRGVARCSHSKLQPTSQEQTTD